MKIFSSIAAAAMGLAAMMPGTGHAATVGYNGGCYGGNLISEVIIKAGHTPVAVSTIDATSLASLDAFMYESCRGALYAPAAVEAAVAKGMTLIVHDWNSGGVSLPGANGLVPTYDPYYYYDRALRLPNGSPALTGPGGTLSSTSQYTSVDYLYYSYAVTALPAGSTVLATKTDSSRVLSFSYLYGKGRVVASNIRLSRELYYDRYYNYYYYDSSSYAPIYAANMIAWAVPSFISCAAEGFTGSKLTLCRQVCEIDQSPSRLLSLIKLYTAIYRQEPPCAR